MKKLFVVVATPFLVVVLIVLFFLSLFSEAGKLANDFAEKLENTVKLWARRYL